MAGPLTDVSPTVATVVPDEVVLLDDHRRAIGTAPRLEVHSLETPLHLAFSAYLFNADGEVLLTRRALSKRTWPGVWTNACCGHPRPGEAIVDAIDRRLGDELGLRVGPGLVDDLECVLPDFAYRAVDASGVMENEICPTYRGLLHPRAVLSPNSDEVMDWRWVAWEDVATASRLVPFTFSPWAVRQIDQLDRVRS
jgi:isopentenyl-diphosphate delta-isomerase type 1